MSLFPASPTQGQITVVNGISYTYDSTKGWMKTINTTDSSTIQNTTDSTKAIKFDTSTISTNTTRTYSMPDNSGTLALVSNIVNLNTNGNLTLNLGSFYDIVSTIVCNSVYTLPTGNKTGDTIEFLISCSGIDSTHTFLIKGAINGTASDTLTCDQSYKYFKFIWSQTMGSWIISTTNSWN